jgi:hypothetical protein
LSEIGAALPRRRWTASVSFSKKGHKRTLDFVGSSSQCICVCDCKFKYIIMKIKNLSLKTC